jgi:hypothetical protein
VSDEQFLLLTPLLDVICMQFLAAGEALKRLEKLHPGLLAANFPDNGA